MEVSLKTNKSTREALIYEFIEHNGPSRWAEISSYVQLADATLGRYLNDMEDKGLIQKQLNDKGKKVYDTKGNIQNSAIVKEYNIWQTAKERIETGLDDLETKEEYMQFVMDNRKLWEAFGYDSWSFDMNDGKLLQLLAFLSNMKGLKVQCKFEGNTIDFVNKEQITEKRIDKTYLDIDNAPDINYNEFHENILEKYGNKINSKYYDIMLDMVAKGKTPKGVISAINWLTTNKSQSDISMASNICIRDNVDSLKEHGYLISSP